MGRPFLEVIITIGRSSGHPALVWGAFFLTLWRIKHNEHNVSHFLLRILPLVGSELIPQQD